MSEKVRKMFASIADDYDKMNSVLSLGIHHLWRKKTIKESNLEQGFKVLDCATGTGDLAIEYKKAVGPTGYVLGTDFCKEMIDHAPAKSREKGLEVDFEVADAMDLPYEDDRFDVASISFGIRNVDDPVKALKEMARVVKPGGKVVVLEFGQPTGFISGPYKLYSQHIMPKLGEWISGNKEAYTYLPETSARFPAGDKFLKLMNQTEAFHSVRFESLMGGIAYIYVGMVA